MLACVFLSSQACRAGETLVLVAGGGSGGDGSKADRARLVAPFGVAFDRPGRITFVEMTSNKLRAIDRDGTVTTLAGDGEKGDRGDGGRASMARLNGPHSLAVGPDGDLYITDTGNNRVRKVDAKTGAIATVAGTGEPGFSGDGGPADRARFGGIYCIAFDPDGSRYVLADLDNRRIRAVDLKTGVVTTIAGDGRRGVPEDGAIAKESPLVDPRAVAIDKSGNVYILERSGHALRVVDRKGMIRTLVGDGKAGLVGDGGPGVKARLNGPKHLCIDPGGNVVIADTENHAIRLYRPSDGVIVRLAGNGRKGTSGLGGAPTEAELDQPHGVAIGPDGRLYIADSSNNRILRVDR
jgi:sugar lactone lactonase YvrE